MAVVSSDDDHQFPNEHNKLVTAFGRSWDISVFPRVIVFDVDETLWPFWIDTHTVPPYKRIIPSSSFGGENATEDVPTTTKASGRRRKKTGRTNKKAITLGNVSHGGNQDIIVDGSGNRIELFAETETVLTTLRKVPGLKLAYASRTGQPSWMESLAKTIVMELSDEQNATTTNENDDADHRTTKVSMWDLADYQEVYPGSKIRHFQRISKQSGVPCHEMLFFDDEPYSNMEVATQLGVTFIDASGGISVEMVLSGLDEYKRNCCQRRGMEETGRSN